MGNKTAKTAGDKDDPQDELTFEDALRDLEAIVVRLEKGNLGLEPSLDAYAQAMTRLKHCYNKLENAKRRVEILKNVKADGTAEYDEFDDEDLDLTEKQTTRDRRRSRKNDL